MMTHMPAPTLSACTRSGLAAANDRNGELMDCAGSRLGSLASSAAFLAAASFACCSWKGDRNLALGAFASGWSMSSSGQPGGTVCVCGWIVGAPVLDTDELGAPVV